MRGYSPFDLDRVISNVLVHKINVFKKVSLYKKTKKVISSCAKRLTKVLLK
jgi:hypothetical protein